MIYFYSVKTTFLNLLREHFTPICFIHLNDTKHKKMSVQSLLFYCYVFI